MTRPYFETAPCDAVLARLHANARGDRWKMASRLPALWWQLRQGMGFGEVFKTEDFRDVYMPVSRDQGEFLYRVARACRPKRIVEFGTSFGISAIYLGAALRDQGFGHMVGTESEPSKVTAARENIRAAGLDTQVSIREGDAMTTLRSHDEPIDLLFLDGWKDLYLPLLQMLLPRLGPGSVVLADNLRSFPRELAPFRAFLVGPEAGFSSTTLDIGDGLELAVRI